MTARPSSGPSQYDARWEARWRLAQPSASAAPRQVSQPIRAGAARAQVDQELGQTSPRPGSSCGMPPPISAEDWLDLTHKVRAPPRPAPPRARARVGPSSSLPRTRAPVRCSLATSHLAELTSRACHAPPPRLLRGGRPAPPGRFVPLRYCDTAGRLVETRSVLWFGRRLRPAGVGVRVRYSIHPWGVVIDWPTFEARGRRCVSPILYPSLGSGDRLAGASLACRRSWPPCRRR